MTKRILSILTAVMLFCSMTMPTVSAEDFYKTYGDFEYHVQDDGTIRLTNFLAKDDPTKTEVIVPSEINGRKVTYLNYTFWCARYVKSVTLPDSITSIYGISYCDALQEVKLPANLKKIERLFTDCPKLTQITIPAKVKYIDAASFDGSPQEIKIASENPYLTIKNHGIYSKDGKTLLWLSDKATQQKTYRIPKGVRKINERVFTRRSLKSEKLTIISLPNSIEVIGDYAFSGMSDQFPNVEEFQLPKSVKKIGNGAFLAAPIQKVTVPTGATVGDRAFARCAELTEVTVKKGAKIGERAFVLCKKLKRIRIAKNVKIREDSNSGTEESIFPGWFISGDFYPYKNVKIYGYKNSAAEKQVKQINANVREDNKLKNEKNQLKFIPLTSLKKAKVEGVKAVKYTKSVKKYGAKQSVKVYVKGKRLKKGRDYTLSYKNNKKRGKATVIITGINKYDGVIKRTFRIK